MYFMAIWYILWYLICHIFHRFGIAPRKIWQLCLQEKKWEAFKFESSKILSIRGNGWNFFLLF
jgi:hypothetical protein